MDIRDRRGDRDNRLGCFVLVCSCDDVVLVVVLVGAWRSTPPECRRRGGEESFVVSPEETSTSPTSPTSLDNTTDGRTVSFEATTSLRLALSVLIFSPCTSVMGHQRRQEGQSVFGWMDGERESTVVWMR